MDSPNGVSKRALHIRFPNDLSNLRPGLSLLGDHWESAGSLLGLTTQLFYVDPNINTTSVSYLHLNTANLRFLLRSRQYTWMLCVDTQKVNAFCVTPSKISKSAPFLKGFFFLPLCLASTQHIDAFCQILSSIKVDLLTFSI